MVESSTQDQGKVQAAVGGALGVPLHAVRVRMRRMGGAFGGKASRQVPTATMAAVAANALRRPVKLVLDRNTDMQVTGGRQEMEARFKVPAPGLLYVAFGTLLTARRDGVGL